MLKQKVLIVDDDTVLLRGIAAFLRQQGYEVHEADSCKSAVHKPEQIAIDSSNDLYEADTNTLTILKFPYIGGSYGAPTTYNPFANVGGIAVDSSGNMFVACRNRSEVVEIPFGSSTAVPSATGYTFWRTPCSI